MRRSAENQSEGVTNEEVKAAGLDEAKVIRIEGYLLQSKLSTALQQILPEGWLGDEVPVAGCRRRWDMSYQRDGRITVVEFDGDDHYRNSLIIKADRQKDEIARAQGYKVIRFPYWVHLDNVTLPYYFGLKGDIDQSFPHGFIVTKIFPASYCEMGIERFRAELFALPIIVRDAVAGSLRDRVAEHGLQYVLPASLQDIAG